jgi:hypothetical protein
MPSLVAVNATKDGPKGQSNSGSNPKQWGSVYQPELVSHMTQVLASRAFLSMASKG